MRSKTFFQTLSILHLALISGVVLIMAVSIFIFSGQAKSVVESPFENPLILIAPVIAVAGIAAQQLLYKSRITALAINLPLSEKLQGYQTATIISLALLEGPALFAVVAFFISGYTPVLGISAVLLVFMFLRRPSLEKCLAEVPLTIEEQTLVSDPDAIVM